MPRKKNLDNYCSHEDAIAMLRGAILGLEGRSKAPHLKGELVKVSFQVWFHQPEAPAPVEITAEAKCFAHERTLCPRCLTLVACDHPGCGAEVNKPCVKKVGKGWELEKQPHMARARAAAKAGLL